MSCGNSVAATVREAYWRPFRLSTTSKPQAWFSLKTQSPLTLEWRLSVKVSHIGRFERTITLATPVDLMDSRRCRSAVEPP
jgi:hypothetical protein